MVAIAWGARGPVARADVAPANRECNAGSKLGDACDNYRSPGVCQPATCYTRKHFAAGDPYPCFKCVVLTCKKDDSIDHTHCLMDGGIGECHDDATCGAPARNETDEPDDPPVRRGCHSKCSAAPDDGSGAAGMLAIGLTALVLERRRRSRRAR
jgi:MYXO-CTERM domain-containing protein